jgi:hypothetical protein
VDFSSNYQRSADTKLQFLPSSVNFQCHALPTPRFHPYTLDHISLPDHLPSLQVV